MAKIKIILVPIFLLSFSLPLFSAISSIHQELATQRHQVAILKGRLNEMEKQLGLAQKTYEQKQAEIKLLEEEALQLGASVQESKLQTQKKIKQTKKTLGLYLLNSSDDESPTESLYEEKTYVQALKLEASALKKDVEYSEQMQKQLDELQQKLSLLKEDEKSVLQTMSDLRVGQEELKGQFLEQLKKNSVTEKELIEKKANKFVAKKFSKVDSTMEEKPIDQIKKLRLPIDTYVSYGAANKGLNFVYQGQTSIYAVDDGRVVYSGELASYGKVVMIDHGQELRTVLLGDFVSQVHKDDRVLKGDVVAKSEGSQQRGLYFEVRKKNIAQNPLLWLDNFN